jgi:hypothetical protein
MGTETMHFYMEPHYLNQTKRYFLKTPDGYAKSIKNNIIQGHTANIKEAGVFIASQLETFAPQLRSGIYDAQLHQLNKRSSL